MNTPKPLADAPDSVQRLNMASGGEESSDGPLAYAPDSVQPPNTASGGEESLNGGDHTPPPNAIAADLSGLVLLSDSATSSPPGLEEHHNVSMYVFRFLIRCCLNPIFGFSRRERDSSSSSRLSSVSDFGAFVRALPVRAHSFMRTERIARVERRLTEVGPSWLRMIEFHSRVDPTDAEIHSALLDAVSGQVTHDHILFDLRSVGEEYYHGREEGSPVGASIRRRVRDFRAQVEKTLKVCERFSGRRSRGE